MSKEVNLPIKFAETTIFTVPSQGGRPSVPIDLTNVKLAEEAIVMGARVVNGGTYEDLERQITTAHGDLKQYVANIGYEVTRTEKVLKSRKSELLLDEWPAKRKELGLSDSGRNAEAFLQRDALILELQDRIDLLKALVEKFEGKMKTFEKTSSYMKKEIDIQLRSVFSKKYTS